MAGATHDAGAERWRLYLDSQMRLVEVLADEFYSTRPDYKVEDDRFRLVRCKIEP